MALLLSTQLNSDLIFGGHSTQLRLWLDGVAWLVRKWLWLGGNCSREYGKADNVQTRSADCDSKTLVGLENGVLVTTCSNLGYNFST